MHTTIAPAAIPVRVVGPRSRRLSAATGVGYTLSWLVGLSVFSSSTQVRSSGAQILRSYSGHQSAVALQYVLTEGLPAVCLAAVFWALAMAISKRAATARRLVLAAGLTAVTVSLVQLVLGLWLSTGPINQRAASTEGTVFRALTQLDGVKMLLIALVAVAATCAIRGHDVPLPRWLGYVGAALSVTLTVSAFGYLTLQNTFAAAAWVSLPCLLVFVTSVGIALSRRTGDCGLPPPQRTPSAERDPQ